MSLRPKNDVYSNDKSSALNSTKAQLDFIRANMKWLARVDKNGTHAKFIQEVGPVEGMQDWERAKIEKIYEMVWKGYEMPAVNEHVDKKRKGLRY
ncbi:MAG: hypothetical protein H3C35_03620 [Bacteroidetes bacterium]|nr:hypothetical protein [Bacteroidota bacterium]